MPTTSPRTILLTGASGGFGRLVAQTLLQHGHRVAAAMRDPAGRNAAVASALRGAGARVVALDVTDERSVEAGVAEAVRALGPLDVAINGAGIGVNGWTEAFTAADLHRVFDVNVYGVQRVTRAVVPAMQARGAGLVLNISSLLGRVVVPFYGPYNASKWALEGLSDTWRVELAPHGVEVCLVEPGGFATSFMDHLLRPSDAARGAAYGAQQGLPEAFLRQFEGVLQATPQQDPQHVADAVLQLVQAPHGSRPVRTTVDALGMGAAIEPYNQAYAALTAQLHAHLGVAEMLPARTPQAA